MTKHKQVQFIGYAVSTKAQECGGGGGHKYYLGNEDEGADMDARLALLKLVLQKTRKFFAQDPETLKIFVIPEFFFRGLYGAYGGAQAEGYLKEKLHQLKAEYPVLDMAVWGTSLLAQHKADYDQPAISRASCLGDEYLSLYRACCEYRTAVGRETPSLKEMLFFLDELEAWEDDNAVPKDLPAQDPLFWVIKDLLAGCDKGAPVMVSNKAQIMLANGDCLTVQKRFKSKVDFVLNRYCDAARTRENRGAYLQTFVGYPPIPPAASEEKRDPLDQYGVFDWHGLKVGVEICLDHIRQRLCRAGGGLDLHIIPSCGVEVTANAVAARANGYVFNCDGDYTLDNACNGAGAHTQLFRVAEAGDTLSGKDAKLGARIEPQEVISVDWQGVERYYPEGAGEVHVYAPQPLARG